MKRQEKKTGRDTSMRTRRFRVIGVVAIVIVFAVAATAISMQASKGETPSVPQANSQSNSSRNALPLRTAQDGHSLTQSQIRPLTQQEAEQMAAGLKELVNQSTEGLTQVHHADGSVSMDLKGRFQSVALAKRSDDGNVAQSCVDNPQAAAAFLGIDRELIDGVKTNSPSRKVNQIESGTSSGGRE